MNTQALLATSRALRADMRKDRLALASARLSLCLERLYWKAREVERTMAQRDVLRVTQH